MEIADAQKFLQDNHRACIAVRQNDGWPQMTFVSPGIDPEGRVIITSHGAPNQYSSVVALSVHFSAALPVTLRDLALSVG
jgi:hypothetical protein